MFAEIFACAHLHRRLKAMLARSEDARTGWTLAPTVSSHIQVFCFDFFGLTSEYRASPVHNARRIFPSPSISLLQLKFLFHEELARYENRHYGLLVSQRRS